MDGIIQCYITASRIALHANCLDPTSWREMHSALSGLHERLSCQVCHKLLDGLYPCSSGYACSVCVDNQIAEDTSMSLLQCYQNLCSYIHKSPVYSVLCSRKEDSGLVELINYVAGVSPSISEHNGSENGVIFMKDTKQQNSFSNVELDLPLDVQLPINTQLSSEYISLQMLNMQSQNQKIQNQPTIKNISKKKKNDRRWGCRCGNATTTPGKLTCFGQRCPCYTEQKSCDRCKCRGCRNPRQKLSNNDDNIETDQIRRKPVTLELVSSLQPSHMIKTKPVFNSYDMIQFPTHSQNYDQGGTEVTLGHVNSIFHSP